MSIKQPPEYELIQHSAAQCLEIFLVKMLSRNLHGHADFEFGLVLQGSVTLHTGSQSIHLGKHDIYAINRYQTHSFSDGSGDTVLLAFQISSKMYNHLDASINRLQFPNLICPADPLHPMLTGLLLQCAGLYFHGASPALMPTSLLLCFLSVLQRHQGSAVVSEGEYARTRSNTLRMNHLLDYLLLHYTEPVTLRELAQREQISVYHLSHLFTEVTGMSFQKYLSNLRFEHALHLVEQTRMGVLDICAESGFSSSRYLNRAFQDRFGMDVTAYRRSHPRGSLAGKGAVSNDELRLSFRQSGDWLKQWLAVENPTAPAITSADLAEIFIDAKTT